MKKVYAVLLMIILFMPIMTYASVLNEVPPYVDIKGINLDDYDITKTITSKKVIIDLIEKTTNEKYSWSFDKNNIGEKIVLNFNIDFVSSKKKEIDSIAKNVDKTYISFSHHGDLPSNADIRIYVGNKYNNNSILNLYYYNESKDQVEFVKDDIKVIDGYVEFEIEHCSDYFLTNAIVTDAVNNPKRVNYIIIGLGIAIFILLAYTLFLKG